MKKSKGISLVALVITIIVLIIITATVMITINGENNMIHQANIAKENSNRTQSQEQLISYLMNYKADRQLQGGLGTTDDLAQYFYDKNIKFTVITQTESSPGISMEQNIVEFCYAKYKGMDYMFKIDPQTFNFIEIVEDQTILDMGVEINKIEEIIERAKGLGEINYENLVASNIYPDDITIENNTGIIGGGEGLLTIYSNKKYIIQKTMLPQNNNMNDSTVATITFTNSELENAYGIYSNGKIKKMIIIDADERTRD